MRMVQRLTSFAPWQTAKVLAATYFVVGIVLALPLGFLAQYAPVAPGEARPGLGFFLALPFIYGIGALIFVPIGCWIYNAVARRLGGIEFTLDSPPRQ